MTSRSKKPSPHSPLEPDAVTNSMNFDSMEDQIRGDELMWNDEIKKAKESREVKKKLDESEVDKRLAELKKKIKNKK